MLPNDELRRLAPLPTEVVRRGSPPCTGRAGSRRRPAHRRSRGSTPPRSLPCGRSRGRRTARPRASPRRGGPRRSTGPAADAVAHRAARSKSRTSSSLVWVKSPVGLPHGEERGRRRGADDPVHSGLRLPASGLGCRGDGHHDAHGSLAPQRLNGGAHARTGGEAVVHQDDRSAHQIRGRPPLPVGWFHHAVCLFTPHHLAALALSDAPEHLAEDGQASDDILVDNHQTTVGDRPRGHFVAARHPELADEEHVERAPRCTATSLGHGNAAARQSWVCPRAADPDRSLPAVPVVLAHAGQHPSCIPSGLETFARHRAGSCAPNRTRIPHGTNARSQHSESISAREGASVPVARGGGLPDEGLESPRGSAKGSFHVVADRGTRAVADGHQEACEQSGDVG